ncbi:Stress-induced-phosphoprotein 1 [Desmophyllum pertusum]|uniref:Stress-induced-phosphoprotein 1 n=1 Tax=Desmophyllum pertusum TaxID=174260 RepID=A0A9X0DAZ5_9CNID|nr:Stress-induced-phosphoprotein 1 [Desmophyllum pertusum]
MPMRFYGDIHPGMEGPYCNLRMVHRLLGNSKEVSRLCELVSKCRQGESKQLYQSAPCDYNVYGAREQKDFGNNLFRAGDYSGALQCYNQALTCLPNDAKLLTNRSATYVQLLKQQRSADDERNYLEHALEDSQNAIAADPSWEKGYYWKAVCLAHLGKRGPSLAAAAVAKYLFPSQCATILAVVDRFGCYDALVVTTVQDLLHLTERADSKNLVIVVKEGRYELPNPLQVPENAVMVGHGEVQITCSKGVPLKLDKTVYMENITLSPTKESIKKLTEKAKRCLNHGQVDAALSLYNEALILCPNDPQILTSIASTYLKSAEQKKDLPSERKSLLELALNNAEVAITADSTWLLGYYTKATSLAELDRKQQALAAAAVFKHLSSGRDVPVVAQRYGGLQVQVVESSDQLRCVFERIKELEGVNQVVLMKEGSTCWKRVFKFHNRSSSLVKEK